MSKKDVAKKVGLGFLALLGIGAIFEPIGAYRDAHRYPEFGRRVDIGEGRKMFLDCRGTGSPTVILEAGHHGWSPAWTSVEPEVAKFTRVCSYDRAGLGKSDAGPKPRNASALVLDLERLFERGEVKPPYVLVGHSAGGMYQRLYYQKHPESVVGMVLVDTDEPTHDADRREVADAPDDRRTEVLLTAAVYTGVFRFATQVLGFEAKESKGYPEEAKVRFRADIGPLARSINDDWMLYQSAYTAVTDVSLGDRPLAVIGALGYLPSEVDREDRRSRQKRLAGLSTKSTLTILDDEAHYLPLLRPELVIGAIHDVVIHAGHP
jgi:pimeloyl-ACP methyl ester carboxylesterase